MLNRLVSSKVRKILRENSKLDNESKAYTLKIEGLTELLKSNYEKAHSLLSKSLESDNNTSTKIYTGIAAYHCEKIGEAANILGPIAEQFRNHLPEVHIYLAKSMHELGDKQACIKECKIAIEIEEDAETAILLVNSHMENSDKKSALECIDEIIRTASNNHESYILLKGDIEMKLKAYHKALLTYTKGKKYRRKDEDFQRIIDMCIGGAYYKCKEYKSAVQAYESAAKKKSDWHTWRLIGKCQDRLKNYETAVKCFTKACYLAAKEIKEENMLAKVHMTLFKDTAMSLSLNDEYDKAKEMWRKVYTTKSPMVTIPLATKLAKAEGVETKDNEIKELRQNLKRLGYEFIPSLIQKSETELVWKNFVYISMAKCGAEAFVAPLHKLKSYLAQESENTLIESAEDLYLALGNIEADKMGITQIDSLCDYIRSTQTRRPKTLFLQTHTSLPNATALKLNQMAGTEPIMITKVRDPRERLRSMIKFLSLKCDSYSELMRLIEQNKDDFNNHMYNRLVLNGKNWPKSSWHNEEEILSKIIMLDIKDEETQNKIKSIYLTGSNFPNLIQQTRLNDSESNAKTFLRQEELDMATEECVSKDYISKDQNIKFKELIEESKKSVNKNYPIKSNSIHPLTAIITNEGEEISIIETKRLLNSEIIP